MVASDEERGNGGSSGRSSNTRSLRYYLATANMYIGVIMAFVGFLTAVLGCSGLCLIIDAMVSGILVSQGRGGSGRGLHFFYGTSVVNSVHLLKTVSALFSCKMIILTFYSCLYKTLSLKFGS